MLGEMYQNLLLSPTFSLYIFWDRQVDSFMHALVSQTACWVTPSLDNTNTQKTNRSCRQFRAKHKVWHNYPLVCRHVVSNHGYGQLGVGTDTQAPPALLVNLVICLTVFKLLETPIPWTNFGLFLERTQQMGDAFGEVFLEVIDLTSAIPTTHKII